jgi:hypothetical protein
VRVLKLARKLDELELAPELDELALEFGLEW